MAAMPVYEYACNRCDGRIEVKQSFNDAPLKEHDGCGGDLRRLLSAPGIVFKGSGWYITDSRSTPSESSSSNSSTISSSSASKSEKAA
jgi:putative FmdB family regulatory protein